MTYEQVKHLQPEEFKRLCGVRPETFNQMVTVMQQAKQQLKPGRPSKLSLEDQVLMTLEYLREYRTYFHIAQTWGIYESTAYRIIRSVEDTLIRSRKFRLSGRKKLLEPEHEIEIVVVDVTETPIERPKKNQKQFYSGKKKRHTFKAQVVVNQSTQEIICTAYAKGKRHDFQLFKTSKLKFKSEIECLGDKGYQGIQQLHANSRTPQKKPRGGELNAQQKRRNRQLAQERVVGEHVNRWLKIFRILSERYRNRRRRFGLRFNLIAGLYNYELNLPQ